MAGEASRINGRKGGRRKGSKATHTIKAETARKEIIARVIAALAPIINALIKKAKTGDTQAAKELLDRAFGKVPQAMEVPGGSGEIRITWKQEQ